MKKTVYLARTNLCPLFSFIEARIHLEKLGFNVLYHDKGSVYNPDIIKKADILVVLHFGNSEDGNIIGKGVYDQILEFDGPTAMLYKTVLTHTLEFYEFELDYLGHSASVFAELIFRKRITKSFLDQHATLSKNSPFPIEDLKEHLKDVLLDPNNFKPY